jgi:predicted PurR-regulated permease PerM
VIAGILSLFAGGWIAARFALVPNKMDRALHGIVVWGLTSLVIVLTLTTAMGSIIGGAANVIAQTGQGAAQQPQLLEQLQGVLPTQEGEQQQVQQQAAEAADQAATAVATAAIWMFVSMLLMAAAAAWGGTIAKGPEYVEERRGEAGQWHERAA